MPVSQTKVGRSQADRPIFRMARKKIHYPETHHRKAVGESAKKKKKKKKTLPQTRKKTKK
jgi:hypothetical protein